MPEHYNFIFLWQSVHLLIIINGVMTETSIKKMEQRRLQNSETCIIIYVLIASVKQ
jgi:hypothetical protein